jgi:G3E family GTPase
MTPVHVVSGFLGAGKTTAITALLRRFPNSAVDVNDFGDARVDATLLDGAATITDIAGGCVCCTAPEGLARTVTALLEEVRPARVFIEPSGLARPQDVLDMLSRGGFAGRVELRPTLVLVDPMRLDGAPDVFEEQLEAADVLVANRCDLATPEALADFRARAAALWPGPSRVIETSFGVLPDEALTWREGEGPKARPHHHDHDHEGFAARSWVWPAGERFAWDALRRLLAETQGLARFKGVFCGDLGWFRLDWAGGRVHVAPTAWRRDSRADLIVSDPAALDAFEAGLAACRLSEAATPSGPIVEVVDADGHALALGREALVALPGQVDDVSALVPGREGSGVWLRELFALVPTPPDARFVLAAGDGLTSAPAPVSAVGDAVLVHSLGDGPLPEKQGGPFRVLVPPGDGRSACANVKGLVKVRVIGV